MVDQAKPWLRGMALVAGLAGVVAIGGCRDADLASLEAHLDALRERPEGNIDVLPPAPVYRTAHYTQAGQRSPFRATRESSGTESATGQAGRPDRERPREPLEQFALERLELVGTLTVAGRPSALIRAPDGHVYRVFRGHYLGTDFGRITAIGDSGVELIERVRDAGGGWRERHRTLNFNDSSQAAE